MKVVASKDCGFMKSLASYFPINLPPLLFSLGRRQRYFSTTAISWSLI